MMSSCYHRLQLLNQSNAAHAVRWESESAWKHRGLQVDPVAFADMSPKPEDGPFNILLQHVTVP